MHPITYNGKRGKTGFEANLKTMTTYFNQINKLFLFQSYILSKNKLFIVNCLNFLNLFIIFTFSYHRLFRSNFIKLKF